VSGPQGARLEALIARVAPGTILRHGLERMLRAQTGGLVVVGDTPELRPLLSGGFRIGVLVTAQRLSELAKMDGAIVIDADAQTILWGNVHLMPDRSIQTAEAGTRHRTAERVARQTGLPVISVSKSMHVVTLYVGTERYVMPAITELHARAGQTLQALERYRDRFDEAVRGLNAMEVADEVTLGDAVHVLARGEMLHRLAAELDRYLMELGVEGRVGRLQAEELMAGVGAERLLLVRDYIGGDRAALQAPQPGRSGRAVHAGTDGQDREEAVLRALEQLSPEALFEPMTLARLLNRPCGGADDLDSSVSPRGFRLLSKVPRLGTEGAEQVVERFGSLARLLAAGPDELDDIEGIGPNRVKILRNGLSWLEEVGAGRRYV